MTSSNHVFIETANYRSPQAALEAHMKEHHGSIREVKLMARAAGNRKVLHMHDTLSYADIVYLHDLDHDWDQVDHYHEEVSR